MATAKKTKKVVKAKKVLMSAQNMLRWKIEFWMLANKNLSLLAQKDCDNECENCACGNDEKKDEAFNQAVDDMLNLSEGFAEAVNDKDKMHKFLDFAVL